MDPQTEIVDFINQYGAGDRAYAHIYAAVVVVLAPLDPHRPFSLSIERVATAVVDAELVERDRVIWLEYQPEVDSFSAEEWDVVTFSWRLEPDGSETAIDAYWLSITRDVADVLCSGDAVVVG